MPLPQQQQPRFRLPASDDRLRPPPQAAKPSQPSVHKVLLISAAAGAGVVLLGGLLLLGIWAGVRSAMRPAQEAVEMATSVDVAAAPREPDNAGLTQEEAALLEAMIDKETSTLDVHTVESGDAGFLLEAVYIQQVIATDGFLARIDGASVAIVGVDTSQLVDGRTWSPEYRPAYFCLGPYTYTTTLNAPRTVIALKPFNAEVALDNIRAAANLPADSSPGETTAAP